MNIQELKDAQNTGLNSAQSHAGDSNYAPWNQPQQPCPGCGRCPSCGRGGYHTAPFWPYQPTNVPYPSPYNPWAIPMGTTTVTAGQSDMTMASGNLRAWN